MRLLQNLFVGAAALMCFAVTAHAEDSDSSSKKEHHHGDLSRKTDEPLNHFGLSYRVGFNMPVRFKNLGAFRANNPGSLDHNTDHNYDDGYVREDNNNHPFNDTTTWNYNYRDASQVQNNQLSLHSTATSGTSSKENDDARQGFELTYARTLGNIGSGTWGVLGAFNYANVGANDSRAYNSSMSEITDVYTFPEGVVPNDPGPAPTTDSGPGTANGPGSLIFDTPISRTNALNIGTTSIPGSRHFSADVCGVRVGPYVDIPLFSRVSLSLSGGLAIAEVSSRFRFRELNSSGVVSTSGSGSHSDLMAGGFGAVNVSAKLCPHSSVFAGVQFQSIGTYQHRENNRVAELDLSKSIFVVIGAALSF